LFDLIFNEKTIKINKN